jgi:histidyl-tRNA synthetase
MSKLQPVRGTHDILPEEFEKFHAVVTRARELATLYGFKEMTPPVFEATEVFSRSMGETSDVVSKEMFTFQTKGEESVTLRPEFTAGIVRSFISNGMQQNLPWKLFSTGPAFRYERPQKGRQRQFHQVNYEWLGDGSAEADIEIIMLAGHLLYSLSNKIQCTLLINTLGDKESRERYRDALVSYLTPYSKELSEDSQRRLITNPLRILDSKSEQDKKIVQNGPKINDFLSDAENERFAFVLFSLKNKVPFFQDVIPTPSLVRGLDYYTGTVFEFISTSGDLGAQNTVLAGGRYDGLVEQMGGAPTPSIGFAAGVERLMLLMEGNWKHIPDIKIITLPFEDVRREVVWPFTVALRYQLLMLLEANHSKGKGTFEVFWHGSFKKRMERANKQGATHVIILGSEEITQNQFILKNMKTGMEDKLSMDLRDKAVLAKFADLLNLSITLDSISL